MACIRASGGAICHLFYALKEAKASRSIRQRVIYKKGESNMTDSNKLKGAIIARGLTQSEVAKQMGICRQTLNYKINNKKEFTVPEMQKLMKILKICNGKAIFFAIECAENAQ
jgi:DNA-binding XRE family transcriptional regulator